MVPMKLEMPLVIGPCKNLETMAFDFLKLTDLEVGI